MPRERTKITVTLDEIQSYYLKIYCERMHVSGAQYLKQLLEADLKRIYPEMFSDTSE